MAKDNDVQEQKDLLPEELEETSGKVKSEKRTVGGRLQWIIIAVVPVICAGAGFGLGRLFGGSATADTVQSSGQAGQTQAPPARTDGSEKDSQKGWYYDMEPVVANLNEPGATRYVRVALTLEISNELDQKKATAFLQANAPLLKNWLTIYLASQTIEDLRGDRNLRRIQLEILDNFNEKLFAGVMPQIKHVLFKEFAIQ